MRKILSLALAVLMVVSLTVVSFSAAGSDKATVTITGFNNESSDTKTYAVGETFTAYVALNASGLNENAMIAALKARQDYTSSVLTLADAYNPEEGDITDLDAMFPVTKQRTVANGMNEGYISYNASNPYMNNAFKFDSDDTMLIVVHYTVKAAGTADITNDIVTLALPDMYLTKVVHKSVVYNDNFKVYVSLSEPAGSTVSGKITSFHDENGEVTVQLLRNGEVAYETAVIGNVVDYSIPGVTNGDYTLRVSKKSHVTRDYDITVSGDTTADAKIHLLGDIDGNGTVTTMDYNRARAHAKGVTLLKDYMLACGDVLGNDGKITTFDANRIKAHAKGVSSLW